MGRRRIGAGCGIRLYATIAVCAKIKARQHGGWGWDMQVVWQYRHGATLWRTDDEVRNEPINDKRDFGALRRKEVRPLLCFPDE